MYKKKIKNFILVIFLVIATAAISILVYSMYLGIEVNYITKPYSAEKLTTSNTVTEKNEITDMLEKATSSVVGISKMQNIGSAIFVEGATSKLGIGTGVIVSENGYILTNQHVSGEKYSNCYVTLENGKTYNGDVVWSDKDIDLSIIKINMKNLPYINLADSDNIKIGQQVYAIGNPIGYEFQRTVTTGIISGINRTIKPNDEETYLEDLIQTDATINPRK